jgi:alpha-galactosidase
MLECLSVGIRPNVHQRLSMPNPTAPTPVDPEIALNQRWAERAFGSETALLFSFVYNGRPLADLVGKWRREVTQYKVDPTTDHITLSLTDPDTRLEVRAECRVYRDTAGVDWTLHVTNRGSQDSPVLEQLRALDTLLPIAAQAPVVLHRLNGSLCAADDWLPFDQPVPAGERIDFATTNGRSSNVSPWFNVAWGGGGARPADGGVIVAIGWSGQWSAAVAHEGDQLRLEAGIQSLHTVLHPGESLRSPRILLLHWQGADAQRAYNLFRHTMFAHVMPRIDGQLVVPPIVHMSTSYYELNDSNEANVLSHLESVRGLGFEMFWLDAYWTGPNGFPNSMGNYGLPITRVEPLDRFPHGLAAIGEAVQREGLAFLMWFEPERVATSTRIAQEHPEWVISPGGDGAGLLNLGIPAARQYITDYLNAAIAAYRLTCLRIDYNIDPLAYWQYLDAQDPQRVGMAEMRYVEGLYRLWDDILRANPGLFIDDCASGGRRIDLETMSRALPLWRSDNTGDMMDLNPETILQAAIKNQVMSGGLNRYVPFSTVGQMGATPYLFRSGFNAGIAFGEDVRPPDYPRELLRQGIAEGRRIRHYWYGDYYSLTPITTSPRDWCILQYHHPQQGEGLVLAFRRHESPYTACACQLREIDPFATYSVTVYHTYEPEPTMTLAGSALRDLTISIPELPGAALIEYRPAP